jgi:hypothetical protein
MQLTGSNPSSKRAAIMAIAAITDFQKHWEVCLPGGAHEHR